MPSTPWRCWKSRSYPFLCRQIRDRQGFVLQCRCLNFWARECLLNWIGEAYLFGSYSSPQWPTSPGPRAASYQFQDSRHPRHCQIEQYSSCPSSTASTPSFVMEWVHYLNYTRIVPVRWTRVPRSMVWSYETCGQVPLCSGNGLLCGWFRMIAR